MQVFVYGTLKRNHGRGLNMFSGAKFIAESMTADNHYRLYDFGAFPAVTFGGSHRITGEVFEINDDVLEDLDRIEGYHQGFYQRKKIQTLHGEAWMYYIPDIENYRVDEIVGQEEKTLSW